MVATYRSASMNLTKLNESEEGGSAFAKIWSEEEGEGGEEQVREGSCEGERSSAAPPMRIEVLPMRIGGLIAASDVEN